MAKSLAIIFGIVLVLVGALGFVSNGIVGTNGYFVTDTIHNIIHIVLGLVVLFSAGSMASKALTWVGILYILLAIVGFVEGGDKLLGFVAYNPADNILHGVLGVVLLVCGLASKGSKAASPMNMPPPSQPTQGGGMGM